MDSDYQGGTFPHDLTGQKFNTVSSRHKFIFKVYNLLTLMLSVTFGLTAWLVFDDSSRNYVQSNPGLLWAVIVVYLVFAFALICCQHLARQSPINYILLFFFTLSTGFLVAVSASYYEATSVVYAAGLTAFLTLSLSLFSCQTKIDFTGMGMYLAGALFALIGFGLITAIVCGSSECQIVRLLYSLVGCTLFSLYLIYDTQLIMGGKHKHSFDEEDHVLAAMMLFLDIVNLFLYLLQLIGNRRD